MPDSFGDFQTPARLAARVWSVVDVAGLDMVVEPTIGRGVFLRSAPAHALGLPWSGFDINSDYVAEASRAAAELGVAADLSCTDVFGVGSTDFAAQGKTVLAIGNPPWVTNAAQGKASSTNLPVKHNRFQLAGLDAMTGKSNFDLAEAVLLRLLDSLHDAREVRLAFLVKRSVAYKLAEALLPTRAVAEASFATIDAQRWFDASVEAGLFQIRWCPETPSPTFEMAIAPEIGALADHAAGFVDGRWVYNVDGYSGGREVEARLGDGYEWRQGIKHDAARVLELVRDSGGLLRNGLGDVVDIEQDCLHAFYKSSDVAHGRGASRVFPLYQHDLSGPLADLRSRWPKLHAYLAEHRAQLAARGSSIYRDKPEFMLFGIGDYSLAPWKVAISGFYKKPHFAVLGPDEAGRPPLVDDTTYLLPFDSEIEARAVASYLNSDRVQQFLAAVVDVTAKRPFTKQALRRIKRKPAPGQPPDASQLTLTTAT